MQTAQKKLEYYAPRARQSQRVVKMQGNVAYIDNGYARDRKRQAMQRKAQARRPQTQAAVKKAPAATPAKKRKTGLASTLFVLFVAFAALAVLVSRYAAVCSISSQNNEIEHRIETLEAKINTLNVDLELRDDLEYVHAAAQDQLGMVYPEQGQRISIDIGG